MSVSLRERGFTEKACLKSRIAPIKIIMDNDMEEAGSSPAALIARATGFADVRCPDPGTAKTLERHFYRFHGKDVARGCRMVMALQKAFEAAGIGLVSEERYQPYYDASANLCGIHKDVAAHPAFAYIAADPQFQDAMTGALKQGPWDRCLLQKFAYAVQLERRLGTLAITGATLFRPAEAAEVAIVGTVVPRAAPLNPA